MDIDDKIARVKDLIHKREEIDDGACRHVRHHRQSQEDAPLLKMRRRRAQRKNVSVATTADKHRMTERATNRSPFPYWPTIDALPYASLIDNASYPTRCHGSVSMCGVGAGAF